MKRLSIYIFSLILCCFFPTFCGLSNILSHEVKGFDYKLLETAGHPRLILDEAGFEDLRQKLSSPQGGAGNILNELHGVALKHAEQNITKDIAISHTLEGKRLLSQSRMALMQIFSYSYVYKTSGDERYALKVRDILKNVCSFPDWNPKHFLDVGEMALAVAIGYDWVYDCLSEDEKVLVRNALKTFALEPSIGHSFRENKGNWNSVCYCGCLAAALVLYEYEKPMCRQLIEDLLVDNSAALEEIYSPDGNYGEGYDYWGYGTSFQVLIFMMLQNVFGTTCALDEIPGLDKTAQFMLYMTTPTKGTFSYADGGKRGETLQVAMWWFAAKYGDMSVLANELRLLKSGRYLRDNDRVFPLVLCIAKDLPLDGSETSAPKTKMWSSVNRVPVAMVHTGWKFDNKDIYLGIKGGSATDCGHSHMDAGSFVYEAEGYRWADDYVRPDYLMIEIGMKKVNGDFWVNGQKSLRWDVFKLNNLSHSTLSVAKTDGSVDKNHPTDHIVDARAEILQVFDTDEKRGAELDMTAPLADGVSSAKRTIVVENEKNLAITDVITAKDGMSSVIQWRMNTPAHPYLCKEGIFLQLDGKIMLLKVKSEKAHIVPRMRIFSPGPPDSWIKREWDKDFKNSIVGFEVTVPAGETCTFTTTLVPAVESQIRNSNLCYSGYKSFLNLRYAKMRAETPSNDAGSDRLLDIAIPRGEKPSSGYPVVVYIHGGEFRFGCKTESACSNTFQGFLENGYAVVSLNYYLYLKYNKVEEWPLKGISDPNYTKLLPNLKEAVDAAAADVALALKWLKSNGGEYGLDVGRIALMGGDAGAMAALQAAYKLNAPGVRCVIDLWGCLDPVSCIKAKSCPVFVIHCDKDDMVNTKYAKDIYNQAKSQGLKTSRIEILGGKGHTRYFHVGKWLMPKMLEFLNENMN